MKYGKVEGLSRPVDRLVLGTMIVKTEEPERSFSLLDAALELGYTTLDTAHAYAKGSSERAIGKWMESRGNREQIVIITKGAHHNADRRRVTPFDMTSDLYDSLARLKTDYIDLYLLHRDDPLVEVGPIVEELNRHKAEGRVRAFGGSNWTHERIQQANDYAAEHGLAPFVASSPFFSLAEQVVDPWEQGCVSLSGPQNSSARSWYMENQMPVFAYSSLARGFFSGRITRENFAEKKGSLDQACLKAYCHDQNFLRLERVQKLAAARGLSVPHVALAYVLNTRMNIFALVGAANQPELASNLGALDVDISADDMDWLDLRGER